MCKDYFLIFKANQDTPALPSLKDCLDCFATIFSCFYLIFYQFWVRFIILMKWMISYRFLFDHCYFSINISHINFATQQTVIIFSFYKYKKYSNYFTFRQMTLAFYSKMNWCKGHLVKGHLHSRQWKRRTDGKNLIQKYCAMKCLCI